MAVAAAGAEAELRALPERRCCVLPLAVKRAADPEGGAAAAALPTAEADR